MQPGKEKFETFIASSTLHSSSPRSMEQEDRQAAGDKGTNISCSPQFAFLFEEFLSVLFKLFPQDS
jgi:hypothetical protein